MSEKIMDIDVLKSTMISVVEPVLAKIPGVLPSQPSEANEIDIVEYDGRMRVAGLEKLNAVCFISAVNFYLTEADQKQHKAKGAMVLYIDSENASKIFKAVGFQVSEDEDDVAMMNACGEIGKLLSEEFSKALANAGYGTLIMSEPDSHKNSIMEGVEFSKGQEKMLDFGFFYWKKKAVAIELSMAPLPMKR